MGCTVAERETKLGTTTAAPMSPPTISSTVATVGVTKPHEPPEPDPEPEAPGFTVARALAIESGAKGRPYACVEAVARALSLTASAHGRRAPQSEHTMED